MAEGGGQESPQLEALDVINQLVKLMGRPGKGYDTDDVNFTSFLSMWKREGMIKKENTKPARLKGAAPEATTNTSDTSTSAMKDEPSKPLRWYTEAYNYWEVSTIKP